MQSVLDGRGKALAAAIHADTLSVILKSNQIRGQHAGPRAPYSLNGAVWGVSPRIKMLL